MSYLDRFLQRWLSLLPIRKYLCWGLVLVFVPAACSAVNRSLPSTPTLNQPPAPDPTFGPQDIPTPPTILAYVQQAGLDKTQSVEFTDPYTGREHIITDQQLIQQIVDTLISPPGESYSAGQNVEQALLMIMTIPAEPLNRTVSVDYNAATDEVALNNLPTKAWPINLQGRYPVPPAFGQVLFELLGLR